MEVVFLLGEAANEAEARTLIARYRTADLARFPGGAEILERRVERGADRDSGPIHGHHAESLAAVSDARLPHLGALRFLSGERRLRFSRPAAGSMALTIAKPALARAHLLRAAADSSSRATCSIGGCRKAARVSAPDQRRSVWLAYVAAHYVLGTGDLAVFDEKVTFSRPDACVRRT